MDPMSSYHSDLPERISNVSISYTTVTPSGVRKHRETVGKGLLEDVVDEIASKFSGIGAIYGSNAEVTHSDGEFLFEWDGWKGSVFLRSTYDPREWEDFPSMMVPVGSDED